MQKIYTNPKKTIWIVTNKSRSKKGHSLSRMKRGYGSSNKNNNGKTSLLDF